VQPIVLRFADATQAYSPAVVYIGDTSLLQSIWRVVSARGLCAHVELLPAIATTHADRRRLAEHLRELIAERLPATP
jgi:1-acyl-sn-glycerol-3-phosphate acyltransferase